MDNQNKNLIFATVLSFLVLVGWMVLFPPAEPKKELIENKLVLEEQSNKEILSLKNNVENQISNVKINNIPIRTEKVDGSISLRGGKINNLKLLDYFETQDKNSENIVMLRNVEDDNAYYSVYGWTVNKGIDYSSVPNANTIWDLHSGTILTPRNPITLKWDNDNGQVFFRKVEIDENYMFSITQTVLNNSQNTVSVAPYGTIARHGEPDTIGFYILHEGIIANIDGTLSQCADLGSSCIFGGRGYDDVRDQPFNQREQANTVSKLVQNSGWIGYTDKYWMTTLIPKQGQNFEIVSKYTQKTNIYQVDMRLAPIEVSPGSSSSVKTYFFAGAKEVNTIKGYQKNLFVENFIDAVDWGMLFFLTKPLFSMLNFFNEIIGNMGWSIILLTLAIKIILLPLAYKSYVGMSKMKKLQPEMQKIKERTGTDRTKFQQELLAFYKKEKVNPAAGCLPILLQIPIFFALYKVLFVTIEIRHAPFFGWIQDLSAPDPTSFINLFGLLPYSTPSSESIFSIISIGVFPILMGVTMWLQQKLNPAPTDKTQAIIFAWMPWVFMFMLGQFSSGLVIYWVANNTITFIQQYFIMKSQGVSPDIFGNIFSNFKKIKKSDK